MQTLLTGVLKPNAIDKLDAFALAGFFDTEVGGYGSEVFPKGALLLNARTRAAEKYGVEFAEDATVYIADSGRDVAAARMGGARSVGVASGRSSASELRDAGADVVLADLSDTANVVRAVDWLTTSVPAGDSAATLHRPLMSHVISPARGNKTSHMPFSPWPGIQVTDLGQTSVSPKFSGDENP